LSPGNIIKIDSEFMVIYDVNSTNDMITVYYRGDRGTSGASHLANAPIYVWEPMPEITRACVRWAAYINTRVGEFQQVSIDGGATLEMPEDSPGEVDRILARFKDKSWQGV
jgi:ferric-dicitrate binding protein FerR (iron transport regulator)